MGPRHPTDTQLHRYPPILHVEKPDRSELSLQQQSLWLMAQFEGGSLAYSSPFAYHLKGRLQTSVLERSWNEIIRRHESLRTSFPVFDGEPTQAILPTLVVKLPVVDLRHLPVGECHAQTQRLMKEWARQCFDLAKGPLLRGALFRQTDEDFVLVFDVHHIVFDGWSMALWISELSAVYNAFAAGQDSPLAEVPIQYTDFVLWQQQLLQDGVEEKQLKYWSNQLRGVEPLDLPTDQPYPPYQSYAGKTQYWQLKKGVSESLRGLCRGKSVSLFKVLTAAWQTLLHRYSGSDTIVIGCPFANRNRPELDALIGFFINTLPLRTDFSGDPTFLELLERVRDAMRGAFANQDVPFGKLVETVRPERDQSRHPFYQVMIVQRKLAWQMPVLTGIESTVMEFDNGTSKFDLSLYTYDDCQQLNGYIEYNPDLFDERTITRMLSHFENLLGGIATDPGQPVSSLPLLTATERQSVLVEWNATTTDYSSDACIHQLFEAQVERTPRAVALRFQEQDLSYQDLNARANQLAHYLRKCGVGRESLVGIFVERSLEMVVGALGVLKAGGAYLPMDPSYPSQRLSFMIEDARPRVLLTQKQLSTKLPQNSAMIVCLDEDWPKIAQENLGNLTALSRPENLAYTIFTSGSTGRPKGVEVVQSGVVNFLESMRRQLDFNRHDVLVAVTSLSFDISYLELFMPLIAGGKVVVVPRNVAVDGRQLGRVLEESCATFMQATPATWQLLLDAGWQGTPDLTVLCGGEALPRELANKLLDRGKAVWNLYGPTETTIWSTAHRVDRGSGSVSIGRPIGNTKVYILDANLQPVPVGIPGELLIGGDGVARGYVGRPDLTEEKFIPHPFSQRPGDRLYRTGDLARWSPEGTIQCLGRLDHQVKIRGFRIELQEIEAVLRQNPAVLEAVAAVNDDRAGAKRLIAYVVASPGMNPTPAELATFVKQSLPEYMVPAMFVLLDRLPLTPNGKVDRRALPVPDHKSPDLEARFVVPRDSIEKALAKLWEETLGVQSVGITDNFFDLGGHSVLGGRMLTRVQKEFGKTLSLTALFQAPTIEQLALILRHEAWSSPAVMALQTEGTELPFFAVYARVGYRELSNELGSAQPFYVLSYDHLFDKETARTLEDIAKDLARSVRSVQAEGPYYLGGMCLAGIVAFATAMELYDQGQEVALLAIMDAPAPGYRQQLSPWARLRYFFAAHVIFHARNMLRLPFTEKLRYLPKMFRTDVLWHFKIRAWRLAYAACQKMKLPLPKSLRDPFRLMGQAAIGYKPAHAYLGPLTVFRPATRPVGEHLDPALGWRALVSGGVVVHEVPGGHRDLMVRPQVTHLGRRLKQCLLQVQAESSMSH